MAENVTGLYVIENTTNGRKYYGTSNNIEARWKAHRRDLKIGIHANQHLQRAWNKYGETSFTFYSILHCNRTLANRIEVALTAEDTDCYNLIRGRESDGTMRLSDETKKKMSATQKTSPAAKAARHRVGKMNTKPKVVRTCVVCGARKEVLPSRLKHRASIFCTRKCFYVAMKGRTYGAEKGE